MEHLLIEEREALRTRRREVDFEDEQADLREVKKEKEWKKQVIEQQMKVEIVRLTQEKTTDEIRGVRKELEKKKESHMRQVEAWENELNIIKRAQAISEMIQDSYIKEITRVKNQIFLASLEESKADHSELDKIITNPPGTASSQHRFAHSKKS